MPSLTLTQESDLHSDAWDLNLEISQDLAAGLDITADEQILRAYELALWAFSQDLFGLLPLIEEM